MTKKKVGSDTMVKNNNMDRVRAAVKTFIHETPKATLRSMKAIMSEFDGMPSLSKEAKDGTKSTDFDAVTRLVFVGVKQCDRSLDDSAVDLIDDVLDMDNLQQAIQACVQFMVMTVPDSVIPPAMKDAPESEGDDQESEGEEKNAA